MRDPSNLSASACKVIGQALDYSVTKMLPLFSGGHDSLCACHVASRFKLFAGVYHIDTGIGAAETRRFVETTCHQLGWPLRVFKSPETYEKFVRERGFPGPGRHSWIYNRLKERCVRMMCKLGFKVALITGCRQQESVRRMGHVEPIKIGETSPKTGEISNRKRIWTAPCFDWSSEEQAAYMDEHDLPKNPLKLALGMSGECFCGAFASPGEFERIERYAPDVATEIKRLSLIAEECGKHCAWGTRPPKEKGIIAVQSGPLCSSCEHRATAAGIEFKEK